MRCKLRDICLIEKKSITPETDKWYYLYSLPGFDNSKTPEKVMGDSIKSGKFVVEPNTILFNKLNVRFRRVWNINFQPLPNSICSTEFIPLRPKNCDQSYLYYVLISNELTRTMESQRTGTSSSHQRIHPDSLLDYEIDLPPLDEQRAIGATLSAIDSKITINGMIIQRLEQIAQAIFKSWFVDFEPFGGEIPSDWRMVQFSSFLTPRIEKTSDPSIPLYSVTDVGILPREEKFKKALSKASTKNKIIRETDIVFGMSREILNWGIMRAPIGAVSSAYNVFAVDNSINSKYLESFIKAHSAYFKDLIRPATREGQGIDKGALMTKTIYLPPDDILDEYYKIEDSLKLLIRKKKAESVRLSEIRDTLLPRLMSGELSVADLKDIT